MKNKEEECLLLGMAYPDYSDKYTATVCMGGINKEGEFRRIYPIPFDKYKITDFHKRRWVKYKIKEKGDRRKESYKIYPNSIEIGDEVSYIKIRNFLEDNFTSINELKRLKRKDETSIGIIKPKVLDLSLEEDENRKSKANEIQKQTTLYGDSLPIKVIPHLFRYHFYCSDECDTLHKIMCEDIEAGMLYWKLMSKYDDLGKVENKMKEKMVKWMKESRDLYFMMGTHFRWKTWLVVSILYPPKRKSKSLDDF